MKKILAVFAVACMLANSIAFAEYSLYSESTAYAELSELSSGCESIGAFADYKSLVDRNLNELSSMNSAERQQLITEILTRAGEVYVSGDNIDFVDGELGQYLVFGAVNVAEAKNYLRHYGMSSIARIPITIDFGEQEEATVKLLRSFLANAYNYGISDILIRSNGVGFNLDIEDLASALTEPTFSISLMQRNAADLNEDYRSVVKSDAVYQLILAEKEELYAPLPQSKAVFYNANDNSKIYCLMSDTAGIKSRLVSSDYNGSAVTAAINNRRWFGFYAEERVNNYSFSDVNGDYWAYEYISYLGEKGIVKGDNGKFYPEADVTREELVKLLVDVFDLNPPDARCSFSDVSESDWFYEYIASAYNCGIVSGVSADAFGVGESVSRQDIAVMAVRAFNYAQLPMEPILSQFGFFADGDTISDYAQEAVMAMYISGFVNGDEEERFNPHSPATRAEVAKIIYLLSKYIERI